MDRYVDGYVLPVPTEDLDAYREMASEAGQLWIDYGALEYFEGVGEDMDPDVGDEPMLTFPGIADAGPDESVVFAFVVFESREHRDEVNANVMEEMEGMDPEETGEDMPFDPARMAYGGFESLVSFEA